jgi:hypothetical protein
MDKKFKFIVSVSSALLNILIASPLFATTYALDVNPGNFPSSEPGFNLGNSLLIGVPNPLPGLVLEFNPNPLPQVVSVRKSRQKWTKEADEILKTAVTTYGTEENWDFIARDVGHRCDQCLDRWTKHVNPSINREPWTPEEKKQLAKLERQYKSKHNKGATISTIISKESGRNGISYDCHSQYEKLTWQELDDEAEAQNDIPNQTAADLVLPVSQSEHGDPWKSEDIELLKQKYSEYKGDWVKVWKHFPSRRKDAVKKYWFRNQEKMQIQEQPRSIVPAVIPQRQPVEERETDPVPLNHPVAQQQVTSAQAPNIPPVQVAVVQPTIPAPQAAPVPQRRRAASSQRWTVFMLPVPIAQQQTAVQQVASAQIPNVPPVQIAAQPTIPAPQAAFQQQPLPFPSITINGVTFN